VALAACTAAALLYFASITEPQYRPRVYGALALDLALPVVAWFVFKRMKRNREGPGTRDG
jgi:hypothetical protein